MKRLELLDYGRFIAAIIVVIYHYSFSGISVNKVVSINHIIPVIEVTKYGYLGVEFFFMISGYVIFFSAQNRSASAFAVSRSIRLFPAYWVAIIFTSTIAFFWGGNGMSIYLGQVIVNFTMLQTYFDVMHVDGVYWTLIYEVQFYFAVFLLLFCGLQKYLNVVFKFWPLLFLIALILELSTVPYLGGYFYYFSAGTLFALISKRVEWKGIVNLVIVYLLCLNFSSSKAEFLTEKNDIGYQALTISVVVTMFFIFFLILNMTKNKNIHLPLSQILGGITYPVYLIHMHFGYIVLNQFATDENKLIIYFLIFSSVIISALVIHLVIERRLYVFWKVLFNLFIGMPIAWVNNLDKKVKKTKQQE